MFKLAMFLSMFSLIATKYFAPRIKFCREIFMSLGSISLDLLMIAAIAVGNFRKL